MDRCLTLIRGSLVLVVLSLTLGNVSRAACPVAPSEPIYKCSGGPCNNGHPPETIECPNGTLDALRKCSEANYNAYLVNFFGPLTFKSVFSQSIFKTLRWSSVSNGDYSSTLE